jgi:transposase
MEQDITQVRTLAIDLAKTIFQVAGEDAHGQVIFEARFTSRQAFWSFLQTLLPPLEVLMETGPGAQAWARLLQARGITVRILPAQRVAEHRSGAKNDRKDTHALLRAGRDASIHAVPVKRVERLTLQAMHRVRSGYVRRRTAISNQIRGLLQEHGLVAAQGEAALTALLQRVMTDATLPVPGRLRELVAELWAESEAVQQRCAALEEELKTLVNIDPEARRLATTPGIGWVIASAVIAKEPQVERFANARQFAAYFGGVPDQHSSGGRIRLGKMSRRGDGYIRSLMISGAHAVLRRLPATGGGPDKARLRRWKQRHGSKGAAVRLANRNLRIIWRLLKEGTEYREAYRQTQIAETEVTMTAMN